MIMSEDIPKSPPTKITRISGELRESFSASVEEDSEEEE